MPPWGRFIELLTRAGTGDEPAAVVTGDGRGTQFAPRLAAGRAHAPAGTEQPRAPARLRNTPPAQIFSTPALRQAWLAVKRAKGGAGVDGVTLAQFEANLEAELAALRDELVQGAYRPRPLRTVLVPKAGDDLRRLVILAIRDRVAQRAVYNCIAPVFDAQFLACSFGFRASLGVEQAVTQVTRYRDANLRWVVDADIRNCFDSIDTQRLMVLVRRTVKHRLLLRYIGLWLDARILESADGRPRRAGTAQGGVLSPLLANVYLHELDRQCTDAGLALVRYADDLVVCCRRKTDAQAAHGLLDDALPRLGLALHPQKTQIVHFDQGFAWLGYFFIRNECYRL